MADNHHFVPQFHLRHFIDPASAGTPDPYLWVADLPAGRIYPRAPKNAAAIRGFNDSETLAAAAGLSLEQLYGNFESRVAPAIARLAHHEFQLTRQERYHLTAFLAFQLTRVPAFRLATERAVTTWGRRKLRELLPQNPDLRAQLDRLNRDRNSRGAQPIIALDEFFTLVPTKNRVIGLTLQAALEFTVLIFRMQWTFLAARGIYDFFTADQPVALLAPNGKPPHMDFHTGHNRGLQIWFPVSPSSGLLLRAYPGTGPLQAPTPVHLTDKEVRRINRSVLPVVQAHVYCSSQQQAIWALKERHKQACSASPIR